MNELNGKTIFIGGGAGSIGAITVRGALRAGATVVTASRDAERFERLRRFIDVDNLDQARLITLEGNLGDEAGALALRDQVVARVGLPDGVINSLGGGMAPAPLLTMPLGAWDEVMGNNLVSHLLAARAFLPAMIERGMGAFILISGYGGMGAWPNSAPVSIAAAGVIALGRNLAEENRGCGVQIRTMVLATSEALWAKLGGEPGAFRGDDVGEFNAWLVSDAGRMVEPDVVTYVTDWKKSNAIQFMA